MQGNHAGSRIFRGSGLGLKNGEADVVAHAVGDLDVFGDDAAKVGIDQVGADGRDQAHEDRDQKKSRIKSSI